MLSRFAKCVAYPYPRDRDRIRIGHCLSDCSAQATDYVVLFGCNDHSRLPSRLQNGLGIEWLECVRIDDFGRNILLRQCLRSFQASFTNNPHAINETSLPARRTLALPIRRSEVTVCMVGTS